MIINMLYNWYKAYPSMWVFLFHKLTHIAWGVLLGWGLSYISIKIALATVAITAIAKEVDDRAKSEPGTIPLYYHVLDILVTIGGGILGVLLFQYLG